MSKKFDYDEILDDISVIKESIDKRKNAIAAINLVKSLYPIIFFGVAFFIIYPLVYYLLDFNYNGFAESPSIIQILFWVSFAFFFMVIGIVKIFLLKKEMVRKRYDLLVFMNKTFTQNSLSLIIPIVFLIIFSMVFLLYYSLFEYMIPILSILIGLYAINYGNILYSNPIKFSAFYLIVIGVILIIYADSILIPFQIIICFAIWLIVMYLVDVIENKFGE